jgi:glycosyltransferase involved in cell wall biosynthesis
VLRQGFRGADALFTYTSAGLELMTAARVAGMRTVMEQIIAPRPVELNIMRAEEDAFPDWQAREDQDDLLQIYHDRERAEWAAADVIICGSEFVRDGIAACGGPVDRCVILPYGVELSLPYRDRISRPGPLRVLTVGAGLRKGTPYILEAARRLANVAEFRLIGALGSKEALAKVSEHIEFLGMVPRSEMLQHFEWADVFLLPSLCEGSPLAVYEALNCGLPVICTPNTGSVVRDDRDGFIVPIRDADAIVDRLERLAASPELRREMSRSAYEQGRSFGPDIYKERIRALF